MPVMSGRELADKAGVKIGAPIVYAPNVVELGEHLIGGTSVDDRAGCAVLLEAAAALLRLDRDRVGRVVRANWAAIRDPSTTGVELFGSLAPTERTTPRGRQDAFGCTAGIAESVDVAVETRRDVLNRPLVGRDRLAHVHEHRRRVLACRQRRHRAEDRLVVGAVMRGNELCVQLAAAAMLDGALERT